jgi:hypothetical protein
VKRIALVLPALACVASFGLATRAAAQTTPLQEAEAAYVDVDFETTLSASQTAIDSGELSPGELARAYELLGVSAAALGDAEAAREVFLRMLSIEPSRRLDDTVPPRFRAPYMEASGIVSARPDRMGAEVTLARSYASLRVVLVDPYEMVEGIRLHMRAEGATEYETFEAPYGAEILVPFGGAAGSAPVEYWLELIDPRGNQLVVQGSQFEPNVLGARVASGGGGGGEAGPAGPSIFEEPVFWIVVGSVIAVGAGIGIGVGVDQASRANLQTVITF